MKSKKLFFTSLLSVILFSFFIFSGFSADEKNKNNGLDLKNLDRSVSPGQDFYQFACGGWIKNNPIPDEYGRYGSFEVLQEENNKVLKKILESAAANKNWVKGSAEQKIGDLFATGMDSARIERDGYKPLLPYLKEIDGIKDKKSFEKAIARFHLMG